MQGRRKQPPKQACASIEIIVVAPLHTQRDGWHSHSSRIVPLPVCRAKGVRGSTSRSYAGGAAKAVTGAVVVQDEVRLPNTRHLKIYFARQAMQVAAPAEQEQVRRVLAGRLQEARQVLGNPSKHLSNQENGSSSVPVGRVSPAA
jgi:hypothetical protein